MERLSFSAKCKKLSPREVQMYMRYSGQHFNENELKHYVCEYLLLGDLTANMFWVNGKIIKINN